MSFQLSPSQLQTLPTRVDLRNPRRRRRRSDATQTLDGRGRPGHLRRLGPNGTPAPHLLHRRGREAEHRREAAFQSSGRHHDEPEREGRHQERVGRLEASRRRLSRHRSTADLVQRQSRDLRLWWRLCSTGNNNNNNNKSLSFFSICYLWSKQK